MRMFKKVFLNNMFNNYNLLWMELYSFTGIAYGQLVGTLSVATYYCSLMALTLFYLLYSTTLPWKDCKSEWQNSPWLSNNTECLASTMSGNNSNITTISSAELWFR